MAQNDETVCVYSTQHEDGSSSYRIYSPQSSFWHTSGGIVSYRGKIMLLTTSQALGYRGNNYAVIRSDIPLVNHDDENDEEIEARERQGSVSDAEEDDGSRSDSSGDLSSLAGSDTLFPSELPAMRSQELIDRRKAILRVDKLDYSLFEVRALNSAQISSAVPLDDLDKIVVHREEEMHVTTVTPSGGRIHGSRRPGLWVIRLPGSNEDLQVYAARFAGTMGLGYPGSWVWDTKTQKLLGHIIIVGHFVDSEIALIMPAKDVFEHARAELDSRHEID